MEVTIQEAIDKLEQAKARMGGNALVTFWKDSSTNFQFSESFHGHVSNQSFCNGKGRSGVCFEIEER